MSGLTTKKTVEVMATAGITTKYVSRTDSLLWYSYGALMTPGSRVRLPVMTLLGYLFLKQVTVFGGSTVRGL